MADVSEERTEYSAVESRLSAVIGRSRLQGN